MLSGRDSRQNYSSNCWIDDLPVCKQSGIGFSMNQMYREDGNRQEEHAFEDRSFRCGFHNIKDSFLYGVFDGHEGTQAVDYCFQKMPAEILLGQLNPSMSDEEIKEVLRQAFIGVENGYMESLNDLLAERASYDVPDGVNPYEYFKPKELEHLHKLNENISSGTAAAIALIYNKTLFVANVGSCRVLLCENDPNAVLKVIQLSIDHDTRNEDEILRLSQLGLQADHLRKHIRLGNQENTRCLGNYSVKGGYKELEDLSKATQEPIISEPDIIGGIKLSDNHRFLLLMSSGLYKAIEEAMGTDQVNKYLAQSIVEQFREQSTITGVAQAVVDKVVRLHHDWHMTNSLSYDKTREDITLVVRNFNFPMPNAIRTPTVNFNPIVATSIIHTNPHGTLTNSILTTTSNTSGDMSLNTNTINSGATNNSNYENTNSSSSSEPRLPLPDPNEKIKPYVNFKELHRNVEIAKKKGTLPQGLFL